MDITERKLAEEALNEAVRLAENRSQELKAIIDSIPDGLTIYDKDGNPTYLNDVSRKILASYRIEDAPPLSSRTEKAQVCMQDGKPITLENTPLYRALKMGEVVKDFVVMSRRGLVYTSLSCAPIRNSDGEIIGAVATHKDISERKAAEKALAESEQRYREIVETTDEGIGIPQDSMNLLFQPFSQMEPSTTRLYGGTGLGLAISRKLVELMGGRIWAESEEGKGSTFHFTIKTSSSQSEPQLDGVSPQLIGKRVFIVSDNKTNRRILGKQVYSWGMIPMIVASGHEALGWVRRGDDFDIAILDMDLQDMSGLGLEREMHKYNRRLPLVLLTSIGHGIPPNHAYLTKPIKPSQLHKVLTEILSSQSTQRAVRALAVSRPIQNRPLRILLAEDNVSSQKVALQMLKKLGYKADVAANGIEALQALERQHYDLVLMDVRMPEMDGLEATKIIRQRWWDNGPKIIAITAYALEGDKEKFVEAGMDDYIAKPVKMDELAKVLSKHQPQ